MQETPRLVARFQRSVQVLIIAIGFLLPGAVASAQTADSPTATDTPADTWGEKTQPENYVPSKGPAEEGHTYNWLQMGYAGLVMFGMVGFMVWLIRRTPRKSRSEAQPQSPPQAE